jgi:hypothetical protein
MRKRIDTNQSSRPRLTRRVLIAAGLGTIVAMVLAAGLVQVLRGHSGQSLRAVIVDQLALTDPNPTFVDDARRQLIGAGYIVDYVSRDEVTVDFYSNLAERGYSLIVLRSHIADRSYSLDQASRKIVAEDHARLFTNEVYDVTKHVSDQLASRLTIGTYPQQGSSARYFTIDPSFIEKSMHGRFDGATVLLMGCSGLRNDQLANAFIAKGARMLIGWDQLVTAAHTDSATQGLLEHLLSGRQEPRLAVAETMGEFGPDPDFGGRLTVYP